MLSIATGTIRCLDDEAWHGAPDLLKELIDSVAGAYGVTAELDYERNVPPTVNDPESAAMFTAAGTAVLGPGGVVHTPQSLGGEDFAWLLESVPGALARLGTRVPGSADQFDLHQPTFDVDERAIGVGVRVLAATALTALWDEAAAQPAPTARPADTYQAAHPAETYPAAHPAGASAPTDLYQASTHPADGYQPDGYQPDAYSTARPADGYPPAHSADAYPAGHAVDAYQVGHAVDAYQASHPADAYPVGGQPQQYHQPRQYRQPQSSRAAGA